MSVPQKWRPLAHEWVEGAEIQKQVRRVTHNEWVDDDEPSWYEDADYRRKPKPKVKKWRWVYRSAYTGCLQITDGVLSEAQAKEAPEILQKIDSTMIEVDDE